MPVKPELIKGLEQVLAETYALYLKTQNYHWNVKGKHFYSLHKFFEEQYTELADAVDDIAELIRSLGLPAPGSFKAFHQLSTLPDPLLDGSETKLLEDLLSSHNILSTNIKATLDVATSAGDDVTAGSLTERLAYHRKAIWMISTQLD